MSTIAACVIGLAEPLRRPLLLEAIQSIYDQTRLPDDTVIGLDWHRRGEVWNANRVLHATDAEWVAFLDDDDLWLPEHLATCEKYMDDADVVVSQFDMVGRPWHTIEHWHHDFNDLRFTNWIGSPSMVCVRRELFEEWQEPSPPYRWIDHANYNRLLDAGARFVCTDEVTTIYRFGEWTNGSWSG